MSRLSSRNIPSAVMRLTEYRGEQIISMTVELDTHGEGVRPHGFVNIRVSGSNDAPGSRSPRLRPLEITIDDLDVLALAHFLNAYVEQRKHLPKMKDPK